MSVVLTLFREKQRELADCEDLAERASRSLQALEATLSETKNQLRQKIDDIRCKFSHKTYSVAFLSTSSKRSMHKSSVVWKSLRLEELQPPTKQSKRPKLK
jgi:hypothetical protein